ncbi:hypothetical protein DE146DRAFT_629222 [Phaeosphaeria sp. MPI-PUGE-AT-0046c]|nr:hypothetical protein DE146DRAFT_629222 [Phaeosphaeria sp. MPI-PUGE-AT-0046c]
MAHGPSPRPHGPSDAVFALRSVCLRRARVMLRRLPARWLSAVRVRRHVAVAALHATSGCAAALGATTRGSLSPPHKLGTTRRRGWESRAATAVPLQQVEYVSIAEA